MEEFVLIDIQQNIVDRNVYKSSLSFTINLNRLDYKNECDFFIDVKVGDIKRNKINCIYKLIYNVHYIRNLSDITNKQLEMEFCKQELIKLKEIIEIMIKNL